MPLNILSLLIHLSLFFASISYRNFFSLLLVSTSPLYSLYYIFLFLPTTFSSSYFLTPFSLVIALLSSFQPTFSFYLHSLLSHSNFYYPLCNSLLHSFTTFFLVVTPFSSNISLNIILFLPLIISF